MRFEFEIFRVMAMFSFISNLNESVCLESQVNFKSYTTFLNNLIEFKVPKEGALRSNASFVISIRPSASCLAMVS
jgi:hypothetical protein